MRHSKSVATILILGIISSLGCTRPQSEASSIAISVPKSMSSQKIGAQSFDQLSHVAINVTGEGIARPIVLNWDADKHDGSPIQTAPVFTLDIPQGSNRLIQVLAVYGDSANSSLMQFFYGDTTRTLSKSAESVNIAVSNVGAGNTIVQGHVMGRYINASIGGIDFGPSGAVDIVYVPPSGKPAMIIDQAGIANGWFQFFGLQGAKLGYRLQDGSYLWGGPVELNTTSFPPAENVLRVAAPLHQQYEYRNGGPQWVLEDPAIYIYGYFGPGSSVANKKVCVSTTPAFSKYALSSNTGTMLTLSSAAEPNLFDAGSPSVYFHGGLAFATASSLCLDNPTITSNLYTNVLAFNPSTIENGNDNAATFRGFFTVSGGNWLNSTTVDPNTKSISGTLLPGIPDVVDSFILFKKIGSTNTDKETASCPELANQGFTIAAQSAVTSPAWSMNFPLNSSEQTAGVLLALCPAKSGVMARQGMWIRSEIFGGGGPPATQLAILDYFTGPSTYNLCQRFMVETQTSGATMGFVAGDVNIDLIGANVAFFSDATCSQGISTGIPLNGSPRRYFYYRPVATGLATSIQATQSAGSQALAASPSINLGTSTSTATLGTLGFLLDNTFARQTLECIPMHVMGLVTGGTQAASLPASIATISASGGGTLYTDHLCSSVPVTSLTGLSGAIKPLFFRATNPGTYTMSTTGTYVASSSPYPVGANANQTPTQLKLNYSTTTLAPSTCMLISVEVYDANMFPTNLAAGQNVTINITGSGNCANTSYIALMDSDCASNAALSKAIAIPAGENRVLVGIKNVATGSGACGVMASLASPSLGSMPMNTNW